MTEILEVYSEGGCLKDVILIWILFIEEKDGAGNFTVCTSCGFRNMSLQTSGSVFYFFVCITAFSDWCEIALYSIGIHGASGNNIVWQHRVYHCRLHLLNQLFKIQLLTIISTLYCRRQPVNLPAVHLLSYAVL